MVRVLDYTDYGFTRRSLSQIKKDTRTLLEYLSVKYHKDYGEVNVSFFSEKGIQDLHQRYLKKNRPTDVLTFKDPESLQPSGDIALCPYRVLLYAFKDHRQPVPWFYHTLLHGLLHLYGLEHTYSQRSIDKIYRLQENILNKHCKHLHKESIYGIFEKIILFPQVSQ